MRLTIDTTTDSKDDLRRVIRFLQLFCNEHEYSSDFRTPSRGAAPEPSIEGAAALGQFLDNVESMTPQSDEKPKEEPSTGFKLDFF